MISSLPSQSTERPRSSTPDGYVLMPSRLLADLRDNQIALGIYALIGRLFLVEHTPIPLSVADVRRYDPSLSYGAVTRAFNRLVRDGWLAETAALGRKSCYLPTWGRINGVDRPWRLDIERLGQPRHISALKLDRRLLTLYIGRLDTHSLHPAIITRYPTRPVLSLVDVGAYALTQAGIPTITPMLVRLGLVRDGQTCQLPSDTKILAQISQLTLEEPNDIELTNRGLRRMGVTPPEDTDTSQLLFFVPPNRIGDVFARRIGRVIGHDEERASDHSAADSGENVSDSDRTIIPGMKGTTSQQSYPPPLPTPVRISAGGGENVSRSEGENAPRDSSRTGNHGEKRLDMQQAPETETAQLLRALNVCPTVIAELASLPAAQVRAAIADGQARPGIRDLGGWVVTLVRHARDHNWTITPQQSRLRPGDVDWTATIAKAKAEGLISDDNVPDAADVADGEESVLMDGSGDTRCNAPDTSADVTEQLIAGLRCYVPRELRSVIDRLTVRIENNAVVIVGGYARDIPVLQQVYGTIAVVLRRLGWLQPPRLTAPLPPNTSDIPAEDRPAWICAARWSTLPAMLRAALLGSMVEAGKVRGASTYLTGILETRYPAIVAELLADA